MQYKRHPTIEEVEIVIKASGLEVLPFERFYGMPRQSIQKFKKGTHTIKQKYWHLFFDPPKPIREKIDRMDEIRYNATRRVRHQPTEKHVSRFERLFEEKKKRKIKVKKIGVLAALLKN